MSPMKCPDCGRRKFYIKDPNDQYTIREVQLDKDEVVYLDEDDETSHLQVSNDTELFCDRCAWHDKFKKLK